MTSIGFMVHTDCEPLFLITAGMWADILAAALVLFLQAGSDYGFWGPVIVILQGVGLVGAGVGLMVAVLVKGSAGTNAQRHALAAGLAERVFAGLFLILLGWFIYDRIVAWTPM